MLKRHHRGRLDPRIEVFRLSNGEMGSRVAFASWVHGLEGAYRIHLEPADHGEFEPTSRVERFRTKYQHCCCSLGAASMLGEAFAHSRTHPLALCYSLDELLIPRLVVQILVLMKYIVKW